MMQSHRLGQVLKLLKTFARKTERLNVLDVWGHPPRRKKNPLPGCFPAFLSVLFFCGDEKQKNYLENLAYHFFRQLWLVLGVKLLEINSNWFSRYSLDPDLQENEVVISVRFLEFKRASQKENPGTPFVSYLFKATLPLKPATIALKIGHLAFQKSPVMNRSSKVKIKRNRTGGELGPELAHEGILARVWRCEKTFAFRR